MLKLILFCEGPGDAHIAVGLLDRVLQQNGPPWVSEKISRAPECIRIYAQDGNKMPLFNVDNNKTDAKAKPSPLFFYLSRLADYVSRYNVRVPRGHFGGRPGSADARMARYAFYIARTLSEREGLDVAIIIRDMDDQPKERATGLDQARKEAFDWAAFKIILGQANPMREAWVLAGFDPENSAESETLKALRQELGFCPCEHSHKLGAKDEQAKKNPKRVLCELTTNHPEREARCWTDAPLERLHARGLHNGLSPFLNEAQYTLPPLLQQEQK